MEELVRLLKERKLTISSAESLTGGFFASELTSIPRASKVFPGSVVTYSNDFKHKLLGVSDEVINSHGVISKDCALMMSRGVKNLTGTDIGVSFTGNAGPDAMEGKPVGRVYMGITFHNDNKIVLECNFKGSRSEIRHKCVETMVSYLKDLICNENIVNESH